MLESIHIENFAIIESLHLEFESGLSALTGETGAGKSIMLDAIKLVAGDRADSDSIRSGQSRAEISVCFQLNDNQAAFDWLIANEMDADGECVLRRLLSGNGRSKAFINGRNATLQQLREICDHLIDIHGQHEHQSLQKSSIQRELLDTYLAQPALLKETAEKFSRYRALEKQLEQAQSGSQEREQRIDLLGLYCEELNQLTLEPGTLKGLQDEHRRLSNA
ncbi:MAG: AAA family ATPase, partial [Pseudomonadota bacterium]